MSDNGKPDPVWRLIVEFDTRTGNTNIILPPNFVVGLGMVEYAKEALLQTQIRPAMSPRVEAAAAIPPHLVKRPD